jgi:hypothetical protein
LDVAAVEAAEGKLFVSVVADDDDALDQALLVPPWDEMGLSSLDG